MATISLTSSTGSGFVETDFDQIKELVDGEDDGKLAGIATGAEVNTIDSVPIGSEVQVLQVVSMTQAAYDLITPVATTLKKLPYKQSL